MLAVLPTSPRLDAPPSPQSPRGATMAGVQLVIGLGSLSGSPLHAGVHSPPASPRRSYVAQPVASPRRAALLRVAEAACENEEQALHVVSSPRAPPPASAAEAALWPEDGGAECVVCFEPLLPPATPRLAAQEAEALVPLPHRSALPHLPCGHACCAGCLAAHLALAVPRAARARPRLHASRLPPPPLMVRCPGLIPHSDAGGDAGWDLRCGVALPDDVIAPYVPLEASAVSIPLGEGDDAVAPTRAGSLFAAAASAAYLWARTRRCPHCGAPSERVEGCRFMQCAHCTRDWCWKCGGDNPDACGCAQRFSALSDMEVALRDVHSALSAAAHWPEAPIMAPVSADIEAGGAASSASGPPSAPRPRSLAVRAARWAVVAVALPSLALPSYVVLCVLWVLPYAAVSLTEMDALAVAAAAGARPPHDALELLPHAVYAAAFAATSALAGPAGSDAAEWRQPAGLPSRCLRLVVASLVAALLAPLIVAVWLAAAPLRFIVAITTEPQDFHEDHPAEE